MNYHNILHDDPLNGVGLRVVLFLSGCSHHCKGCQNKQTWDPNSGIEFDEDSLKEIENQLNKPYIDGITFSGGDPLYKDNRFEVSKLTKYLKSKFPNKTIWIYTGYTWEYCLMNLSRSFLNSIDVIVDGTFDENLKSIDYHWAGSTNQRIIDVKKSLETESICLFEDNFINEDENI